MIVLEDDPNRHRFFARFHGARITTTVEACRAAIKESEPVDLLCLDHDLGGKILEDATDTAMPLVEWLVSTQPEIGCILIHSCNAPAAERMESKLLASGYRIVRCPFVALTVERIYRAQEQPEAGREA
jgi:hypothetical protein